MNKYESVKRFYQLKVWSIDKVRDAVVKNWITPEQFQEITGQEYTE